MKFTKIKLTAAILVAAPLLAQAVPVKNPDCSKIRRINEVPGSSGSYFNADCTTLYILPPRRGLLTVNGYQPSPNIGIQCERLKKIELDSTGLQDVILSYTERLKRYSEEIKEIEDNLRNGLIPIGETADSLEAKIDALVDKASAVRLKIVEMQDQDDTAKLKFSKAEGGRGTFLMESTFPELLQAYRDANPGVKVMAMPIDQTFLSINEERHEDNDASVMPAVLRLRAIGVDQMPLMLDPVLYLKNKDLAPHTAPAGSKIFGGALSGDIQLSNIGACAVLKTLGQRSSFKASDLKSYIAATASYGYQIQVTRKHSIKYNFQELVRQLHEQTKKGGLFSSSTLDSFVDERSTGTWIEFKVDSNDTRYEYTDQYIREVKREFLDRALAQIVALQTGSPAALMGLIQPGKNGASVGADELGKCPNMYCQIGAAGLRVLDSIFGSSKAVASLLKTVKGEMVETVTENKMVPAYSTYTFE